MEEKNFICTACPMGCKLIVRLDGNEVVQVLGHRCRRGENYGAQEATTPKRMLATTVRARGGLHPLLPVYTSAEVPKAKMREILAILREVEITCPVKMGDMILKDIADTGVDILASRDL